MGNTKNQAQTSYRVCTECEIHHYENCRTCFGFGLQKPFWAEETFPVSAHTAHSPAAQLKMTELITCPECGSTIKGVPEHETP